MSHPAYGSRFAPGAAPPPPAPPPPPKRSMRPVILGVGAIAVIALAVVVALAITLGNAPKKGPNSNARPSDAALAFLDAVASGDAAKALSLQTHQPADRLLLTDESLAASRRVAPITDIAVVTDTETVTEVSYRLGSETKRALFKPVRQPDGTWRIERGTTTLQINRRKGLPVLVDGVEIDKTEVEIFPGAHGVTTGKRYVAYAEPTFTAADGQAFPRLAPAPRITEEGRTAFLAAAKAALDACVQQKSIDPPDCPQHVGTAPDLRPDLNTLRWRLEGPNPADGLQPRISGSDDTIAEAGFTVDMSIVVKVTQGKTSGEVTGKWPFKATAVASLMTEPMQVKFRR
ncbi:hypothetical protein [Mariniluteicoccus flavus]